MDLNEYQVAIEDVWIKNKSDLVRIVLGVSGEAGEIAEKFKKYYRGDYEDLKDQDKFQKDLSKEIGDVSFYLAKLCNEFDLAWEVVLEENIEKLQKRKKENKLKGSGDNR